MRTFYLPGLNGIRAIACLTVFFSHFGSTIGKNYSAFYRGFELGGFGVTIFFALSGFLITTLLLEEKKSNFKINFKNFYIRRILRIWPLYFLIVLIGFICFLKYHSSEEKISYFLFFIFFIGNYAFTVGRSIWSINPLWSVGVEEQFYAIWPILFNSKKIARNLFLFLFVFLSIKLCLKYTNKAGYYFLGNTRIDCMAIGGILAYLNAKGSVLLKLFFSKIVQATTWIIFLCTFVIEFHVISFLDQEIYSLIVGIIILNVSFNPASILSLENPVLNYLGKISYGLYAFHMPIIFLWTTFTPKDLVDKIPFPSWTLIFILLFFTIMIAHLSYFYFEKRFLAKKSRYSTINTATAS